MKTSFLLITLTLLNLTWLNGAPITPKAMHFHVNGFIKNVGQFCDQHGDENKQIVFLYVNNDFHLALRPSGFSYELIRETPDIKNFPESGFIDEDQRQEWRDEQGMEESVCRVDLKLIGANQNPEIVADDNTGTVLNYYLGKNVFTDVPSFNRITYKNIYPHIDLVFENQHSENGDIPEYSFVIHPGGDPHQIQMKYSGAGALNLEDERTLSITTPNGFIKESSLCAFYSGDISAVSVSFHLKNNRLSFDVSADKNRTLVIDPSIVWGSYFGGTGSENWDTESEITLDKNNNVFLTGSTTSSKNIATNGAVMQTYGGARDMLLAKFSLDGKQVLWATYFGGKGQDVAYGINCDSHNNIVITGFTKSPNVMTTPGVFQTTLQGKSDVLIAKFSNDGHLIWCSLMGGSDDTTPENGRSMICDAKDNIYVIGYVTSTTNISTTGAYQAAYAGNGDPFLVKFSSTGQKIWGTYFSGTGQDRAHALCFDNFGHVYFVGTCQSKKKFISGGFQTKFGGNTDAFIVKFDTMGKYYWSSYYGGTDGEHGRGVKCDASGNIYFDGWSNSKDPNVISTPNSYQSVSGGGTDGFIAKFTPNGSRIWGTYFGGSNLDIFYGMTIDPQANIYVNGSTSSSTHIATPDGLQPSFGGDQDAMLAKLDSGGHLMWASYLGGTGADNSFDIERDSAGMIYLDLETFGPLPVTPNAYQTTVKGSDDLAVFELNFNPSLVPCADNQEPNESFSTPYMIINSSFAGLQFDDSLSNDSTTFVDSLITDVLSFSGSIASAGDQDWYSLQLPSHDSAIGIVLKDLTMNYDLKVFDSNNALIASSANTGTNDEMVVLKNDSGTIYFQIAHDATQFDPYNCYTFQINDTVKIRKAEDSASEKLPDQQQLSITSSLKIYPNPSSGKFFISFNTSDESTNKASVKIMNPVGQIISDETDLISNGELKKEISFDPLHPTGIYLVMITANNKVYSARLLYQK